MRFLTINFNRQFENFPAIFENSVDSMSFCFNKSDYNLHDVFEA